MINLDPGKNYNKKSKQSKKKQDCLYSEIKSY